jgi:putative endonuclease
MPYWVYILQNEVTGKLYKGQTSNLEKRIERHGTDEPGSMRYTHKQKGPWRLIYSEQHATRSEAMKREKFLKSGQGREWIKGSLLK